MDWLRKLIRTLNPSAARESEPVDEVQQSRLISQTRAGDVDLRLRAVRELADYPTAEAGEALAEATKDREVRVRREAAFSLQEIAEQTRVPVTPVMDALQLEPAGSDALFPLVGALRALGPGVAAERVASEKLGWGISRASEDKIEELIKLRERAVEVGPDPIESAEPFDDIFERLTDEDPDFRNEARRILAENRFAVRRLWTIYNELLDSEPRRAVLAGRVLGHRLNPRGLARVSVQVTMTKLGMPIAFTKCPCPYCGRENPNIPVTERGLELPHKGQRDRTGAAFTLPVLCDFCGNEFCVAWGEDPRL